MNHLQRPRRAILAERYGPLQSLLWLTLALAAPTTLASVLDHWLDGVPPLLAYFPAITLAALFLGWRWGTAALVVAAIACDFYFMPPLRGWALAPSDGVVLLLFLLGGVIIITTAAMLRRSVARLQAASEREHELNNELKHRVNNTLAIMQAFTKQAARSSSTPMEFYGAFSKRLDALREAHDVLSTTDWSSCDMPRLAERGLKGYLPSPAIRLVGPACTLPPDSCVPLTLALSELATNATKHGALGDPAGLVDVDWDVEGDRFILIWTERGGPRVSQPTRKGLGARLLAKQYGLEDVAIEYLPAGVRCTITIHGAGAA